MGIELSGRIHVTSGTLDRDIALPDLPGASPYRPAIADRLGEQLQGALPIIAAGGVGGGVIGSRLLRGGGGVLRMVAGGLGGVLVGASLVMGALALGRGTDAHRLPRPAATMPSTEVQARERVLVMSYNLHGGMGPAGSFGSSQAELDALADVIRRERPDVVLLQEVDRFAARSNWTDTLAELDRRLDPTSSVGASVMTTALGRDQDVAVMTFNGFRVEDARNLVHPDPRGGGFGTRLTALINKGAGVIDHVAGTRLQDPLRDYQARNSIEAMVRTPAGTAVRVLSGHYEWPNARYDHQQLQVGALARGLDAWRGPTIWGADFNVRAGSADGVDERRLMAAAGLRDTADHLHVPAHRRSHDPRDLDPAANGAGIDRIYASRHMQVLDARSVTEAHGRSDHLPVIAELELTPPG